MILACRDSHARARWDRRIDERARRRLPDASAASSGGCPPTRSKATPAIWPSWGAMPPGSERAVESLDARRSRGARARAAWATGRSPRSVARLVACVRGFYRFLVLHRHVRASPADDLAAPRAWKVLPKFLSVEDVDKLIARARRDDRRRAARSRVDRAAVRDRVARLRAGRLRPQDLHLDAGYLTATGKGRKQRIVPFGDAAAAWVAQVHQGGTPGAAAAAGHRRGCSSTPAAARG